MKNSVEISNSQDRVMIEQRHNNKQLSSCNSDASNQASGQRNKNKRKPNQQDQRPRVADKRKVTNQTLTKLDNHEQTVQKSDERQRLNIPLQKHNNVKSNQMLRSKVFHNREHGNEKYSTIINSKANEQHENHEMNKHKPDDRYNIPKEKRMNKVKPRESKSKSSDSSARPVHNRAETLLFFKNVKQKFEMKKNEKASQMLKIDNERTVRLMNDLKNYKTSPTLVALPQFLNEFPNLPPVRNSLNGRQVSTLATEGHSNSMRNFELKQSFSDVLRSAPLLKKGSAKNIENSRDRLPNLDGYRLRKRSNKSTKKKTEEEVLKEYINSIVAGYLKELRPKRVKSIADYRFSGNAADLEEYAMFLVKCGFGRIVENVIRINRKNNRQSFITISSSDNNERDGMVMSRVARRYAWEGDTVRAFVFHSKATQSALGKDDINDNGIKDEDPNSSQAKQGSSEMNADDGNANSNGVVEENSDYLTEETANTDDDDDYFDVDDDDANVDDDEDREKTLTDGGGSPKAFVIKIVNAVERLTVGLISFKKSVSMGNDKSYYKLKPSDMKLPIVLIESKSCEPYRTKLKETQSNEKSNGFLFVAKIQSYDNDGYCYGELIDHVGEENELQNQLKAIIICNRLDQIIPFEGRFNDQFAGSDPPNVLQKELEYREDLRKECIFTIDPLTARDLDDAISIDPIDENTYKLGVHIADVSFYLPENCELDNLVKDRATSIYLVNEVLHMLPETLCMKCSLLPGESKYAISVFWRIDRVGKILSPPRITRSVVNTCAQLAYEHVYKIMHNKSQPLNPADFPDIKNGFTFDDVVQRIGILRKITNSMRSKRFANGAIWINNIKLYFELDPVTGEPIGYEAEKRTDANYLIEELMLLANEAVADFIYRKYPMISILRNHAPPIANAMNNVFMKLQKHNIQLDTTNSKTLFMTMNKIIKNAPPSKRKAMEVALSHLLAKPLQRANYFCSNGVDYSEFWHYGLNVPIYTHFTSPIRRYPDILVHRIITAALGYTQMPNRAVDELNDIVKVCNEQKYFAKKVNNDYMQVYFTHYVRRMKTIDMMAVVVDIGKNMASVVTIATGHALDIHYKEQKVVVQWGGNPLYLTIYEKCSMKMPTKIELFSTVPIKVSVRNNNLIAYFSSPDRKQRRMNCMVASLQRHSFFSDEILDEYDDMNAIRDKKQPKDKIHGECTDLDKPKPTPETETKYDKTTCCPEKDNQHQSEPNDSNIITDGHEVD